MGVTPMTDDIEVVGTARVNDRERDMLLWLVHNAPWHNYATIAKCWGRIRQQRNIIALAKMRQGDSSCGLERIEDADRAVEYAYPYRAFPGQVRPAEKEAK
jgi:hypothetical protein